MREWLVRGGWFYLLFSFEISLLDSDPTSMVISEEDGLFYIRERERGRQRKREKESYYDYHFKQNGDQREERQRKRYRNSSSIIRR